MVLTTNHKETLSLPSPQVSRILVSTHLSIFSLRTHASVLSNPNSAPTASPKLLLLRLLLTSMLQKPKEIFQSSSWSLNTVNYSFLLKTLSSLVFHDCVFFFTASPVYSAIRWTFLRAWSWSYLLLWLHLLLNFNYSHFSVSSQGFSLLSLRLASVSNPIAYFMFYI